MNLKKLFTGLMLAVLSYLLVISLLAAANTSVFTFVTSDSNKVKQIISESGAYENASPLLVKSLQEESKRGEIDGLALSNPQVKKILAETFDGQFVKTMSENMLDETYGWLEGKSDKPTYEINFEAKKKELVEKLSNYAANRFEKLPKCPYYQPQASFDVFTAKCAPVGVTKKMVKDTAERSLSKESNVLPDETVSVQDLDGKQANSPFEDLKNAPAVFQAAKALPIFLVFLAALSGIGVVTLSQSRRLGLKRVGIGLAVTSVLLLITPLFLENLAKWTFEGAASAWAKDVLYPIVKSINAHSASIYYWFALGCFAASVLALAVWWRTRQAEPAK